LMKTNALSRVKLDAIAPSMTEGQLLNWLREWLPPNTYARVEGLADALAEAQQRIKELEEELVEAHDRIGDLELRCEHNPQSRA
jgi:hypothetical protein